MDSVRDSVITILGKYLNDSAPAGVELPLDEELVNLGLDSMNSISLLLELESTFSFVFPDEKLNPETFRTARNVIEVVEELASGAR